MRESPDTLALSVLPNHSDMEDDWPRVFFEWKNSIQLLGLGSVSGSTGGSTGGVTGGSTGGVTGGVTGDFGAASMILTMMSLLDAAISGNDVAAIIIQDNRESLRINDSLFIVIIGVIA
ncbi:hypothetical protein D3C73_1416650 [compost metagenome]